MKKNYKFNDVHARIKSMPLNLDLGNTNDQVFEFI